METTTSTQPSETGKDRLPFLEAIKADHLRVAPCFMTGKGCVYTDAIDEERRTRQEKSGFLVMPFRPNLNVFHNLTLHRFISANYSLPSAPLKLGRADQVTRTGYVICNKICRRIQESDFILADISLPNANVFYEIGLAYGLHHKIVLIHHIDSDFGKQTAEYLGAPVYRYRDLDPITSSNFVLSQYLWKPTDNPPLSSGSPNILVLDLYREEEQRTDGDDIGFSFLTHVKATIGVCVAEIENALRAQKQSLMEIYGKQIGGLSTAEAFDTEKKKSFREMKSAVADAFCTIIRTGKPRASMRDGCDPMAYFWLGYCHATGKNVIPVTVVEQPNDDVDDLAFDIRALWHMRFSRKRPELFLSELQDTLQQMIVNDFTEWSRKSFWDQISGKREEISIFTGALHNDALEREMTGDWDLRAVSELSAYLAKHQYRARIESPVYQPRFTDDRGRSQYIEALKKLLWDKNCVLIASPDVNPLTEIALGALYGVPEAMWFNSQYSVENTIAVVAKKWRPRRPGSTERSDQVGRTFYREEFLSEDASHRRGFVTSIVRASPERPFYPQSESSPDFETYGHLLLAPNPFSNLNSGKRKFLVILNGIGGPATFALTHVITGGVNDEWAAYPSDFHREPRSEEYLREITSEFSRLEQRIRNGIQYIFEITIGPPDDGQQAPGTAHTYDRRRVKGWKIIPSSIAPYFKTL